MDVRKDFDVRKVRPPGSEQLELSRGNVLVRGNDDNSAFWGRCAIGQELARRDVSGELQGEKGFLATVIAVEERDPREGNTVRPEPVEGLGRGLGKVGLREGGRAGGGVG
jgi:hypothetical protein